MNIEMVKLERLMKAIIKQADNKYDGIDDVKDLARAIADNPRRTKNMINSVVYDYCEERNICYKCNQKMKVETHNEGRGECRGFDCNEEVYNYVCESCGLTY